MKNLNRIRIGLLCAATVVAPSLLMAQMPNSQMPAGQQSPQPGMQPGAAAGNSMGTATANGTDPTQQTMKDKAFVREAAEGGLTEVQLGQLAAQKGGSDDVKQFGQKMVEDHTKLNESIKPVAQQMGVRVPTKLNRKNQAEYDKLNGMSGADFDKEYVTNMVKDHKKDLQAFQMEDSTTQNPNLKAALDQAVPVIQQHLQMISKMAEDKGLMQGHKAD